MARHRSRGGRVRWRHSARCLLVAGQPRQLRGSDLGQSLGRPFPCPTDGAYPEFYSASATLGLLIFNTLLALAFAVGKRRSDQLAKEQLRTIEFLVQEVRSLSETVSARAKGVTDHLAQQTQASAAMRHKSDDGNELAKGLEATSSQRASEAATAHKTATSGAQVLDSAINSVMSLAELIDQADGVIRALSSHSQRISGAAEKIEQVAFQSNILALNATLEAAHTGPNGRGFAMVADNVRKLAKEAGESASDIASALQVVLEHVRSASTLLGNGKVMAESSRSAGAAAQSSLHSIRSSVQALSEGVQQIQQSSTLQRQTNEQRRVLAECIEYGIDEVTSGSSEFRVT